MPEDSILRWVIATVVLVCLLGGLSIVLKQLQQKRIGLLSQVGRRINVIEQRHLDPKTKLVLAEIDGHEVLLAVGPHGANQVDLPKPAAKTKRKS